jgi:hypothetical protein
MQKTKNLSVVTKKAMKFRNARTHAKFSSSRVRRKKLCTGERLNNLLLLIIRKKIDFHFL